LAKKKSHAAAANAAPLTPAAYTPEAPWWPADFAPFRFAIMPGVFDPLDLPMAHSRDIATLIWCFFFVVGNALIHPSLGLISLATLRPWLDGYTFKNDNVYFLWGAVLLLLLWGVRALLRNEPLRYPLLTALSFAYLLVALALSPWSINFAETYKQLLLWTSYAAVFAVTLQNVTSPRTQRFVLWAVIMGMALQALFAVLQYYYVLPFLRHLINQDPSVLKRFFGVDHVTPAMQHRFNKNRAFGTVLFPNALAAFLILGIPGSIALLRNLALEALPSWRRRSQIIAPRHNAHRHRAIAAMAAVWFAAMVIVFALTILPTTYDFNSTSPGYQPPWYYSVYFLFAIAAAVALLPAAVYFRIAVRHGLPLANQMVLLLTTGIAALLLVWALWLSYSRGGMLALLGGCAAGALLCYSPASITRTLGRWLPHAAALILIAATGLTIATTLLNTAEAQAANTAVTRQGENVSFADLANPESFSLRLSYWRVGLRMCADNFATGVGLGCFKWAYPAYQYLGAGNVQEAHNSYLQAFTETGVFGGLVLLGFWLFLMAFAAVRIAAEQDPARRRLFAALFAGLAAFLLHSAIDINFAHPTLMFFAMLFAGMLCAMLAPEEAPAVTSWRTPFLIALLAGATFAAGLATRPWLQTVSLSRMQFIAADPESEMNKRFDVANHVIVASPDAAQRRAGARAVPILGLEMFDLDLEPYLKRGRVYVPNPNGNGKLIPAEPGTPLDSSMHIIFRSVWGAENQMRQDVRPWLESLKAEDARFPLDPQIAMHLSNWYQLLTYWAKKASPEDFAEMRRWADETIARNPMNADAYLNKARCIMHEWYANRDNPAVMDEIIALFEKASSLAPAQSVFKYEYAGHLRQFAEHLESKGDPAADSMRALQSGVLTEAWNILTHGQPEHIRNNPPPGMSGAGAAPAPGGAVSAAPARDTTTETAS
jgi:O-antigen ligase